MRSYLKKYEESLDFDLKFPDVQKFKSFHAGKVKASLLVLFVLLMSVVFFKCKNDSDIAIVELSEDSLMKLTSAPVAATGSTGMGTISIPVGTVKLNPFVPYRNVEIESIDDIVDVPSYTLTEPPVGLNEGSDAARVMDTIVSGILYDKYSPSAIINIEGTDYLVKKGDVVNNYKILCIAQDSVTVKLGENTYKAGIGEILTEGTINHNDVSNLNNKFGGVK